MQNKGFIGVVGGGISGISVAYFLNRLGYKVEVIEANPEIGGRVGCDYIGDRRIEFGGKNIGRNYPLFREFVDNIGDFDYEFFGISTSTKSRGKLKVIDSEKTLKTILNVLSLTGVKDFLRLLPLIASIKKDEKNGYLDGPYFRDLIEQSNDRTLSEYFSKKFCRNFARPITVRMNGSEPEDYYLGNFGTNIKMIMDKYDQITDGVYGVLEKFCDQISVRTNTQVTGLVTRGNRIIGVNAHNDGNDETFEYDAVVLATPAPVTALILDKCAKKAADLLRAVRYNPVAIAVVKYNRDIFPDDARAIVFDSEHMLSNAGAYGIHDLDIVRYTYSGRKASALINESTCIEDLIEIGESELCKHIHVDAADRTGHVYRHFKNGLCAYTPHHAKLMDDINRTLESYDGLYLTGDYVRGAAIEACFRSGHESAQRIDNEISSTSQYLEAV